MKTLGRLFAAVLATTLAGPLGAAAPGFALAQPAAKAPAAIVERVKVHGSSLEGSLEGDSADRDVFVILPPSYRTSPHRRYPVVYVLHGYAFGAEPWVEGDHIGELATAAFAKGAREMILVFPDARTKHDGAMYSSSVTTGDFEAFIASDLPHWIDGHYRTLADRRSRGLAGHSMGGYGATRIGMKHPEMFGALYIMSPCCLSARDKGPTDPASMAAMQAVRTHEDSLKLPFPLGAQLAVAAAWSPNPSRPPLYLDLPGMDGVAQSEVLAKWAANAPLAVIDQYVGNLRRYRAIGIEVGDEDGLKADTARLSGVLDTYRLPHSFEIYAGNHYNRVPERLREHLIPFFSRSLAFSAEQ